MSKVSGLSSAQAAFDRYQRAKKLKINVECCDETFLVLLEDTSTALNVELEAVLAIAVPVLNLCMGYSSVAFSKTYSCRVINWVVLCMTVAAGKSQVTKFFQVRCVRFL
jgi:hypothetical protein